MHLSVTCTRCESKYQLDAGMRGKRMRCPNPICRAVFEVRDDNDPPVEAAPPAVVEKPVETPKLVEAKKPDPPLRKPVPKPVDDFPGDDEPAPQLTETVIATESWQPGAWEAPPARDTAAPAPTVAPPKVRSAPPAKRRWALWAIFAMLLVLGLIAGGSYWRVHRSIETNETERFQLAESLYKDEKYAEAASALQKLGRDFPDSAASKRYRFLAELSDVREAAHGPRESPEEMKPALERMLQFAAMHQGDPLLKERASDVWQSLDYLAKQMTDSAEQEKSPAFLALARRAWVEAKKYPPPSGVRERKLSDEWTRIEAVLAAYQERQRVVAILKKNSEHPTAAGVQEAVTLVEATKHQDDAEIRTLLNDLFKAHREQVRFLPEPAEVKLRVLDDDALPSLSVTPSLKAERAVQSSAPLVLALARGVLYALDPAKGEVRWVKRVGIDSQVLPLRVKADAITPELLLVVSSDQRSLSAVIAQTGETLWQTPLSDACVGTPVLVDRQVLVPTLAGRIEEIELAEGRRVGAYLVGQPLTLGGVHQPGTPFVYFPADEFCLYVFDVTKRTCTNILYTRHPAGSLRGLPAIVPAANGDLLLWFQARGSERVEIKPYALPIGHHEQKPIEPIVRLPGISARPWCDADRLAVVTDAGFLSLWGIRQKGTLDSLLFPLLKEDFPVDTSKRPGRGQVVYADRENFWTLTQGRLQRVESVFDASKGPSLIARWTQPIALGSALHAAEARREPDGRTILYLTTQADGSPTCLCSAIDADDGKVLWQRQLGILPQEAPRLVGGQIVVPGAHGVLWFQPTLDKTATLWRSAGAWLMHEPATSARSILLTNDAMLVQLSWPNGNAKMRVRIGQVPGDEKIRTLEVPLPAPLQGTPDFAKGFLLLPLANGILVRVNLQDGAVVNGPDWRAVGAEEDANGHVALLSATEFVVTDGSRGVARIVSADGKSWDKRAAGQLSHRITAPPVIVPDAEAGKARIFVADASDTLNLLEADRLMLLKRWTMPGKITAGPFVRAGKIGCVVGKNSLVWLDPNQVEPMRTDFRADIVGEPNLIDGILVVADVAGNFLALDPASGRPVGSGLTLKANVAATAAPSPFGAGRAFVPLTDGTIILLPLAKLH